MMRTEMPLWTVRVRRSFPTPTCIVGMKRLRHVENIGGCGNDEDRDAPTVTIYYCLICWMITKP